MNVERWKYDKIYIENAIPGYGSSCHGDRFLNELADMSSVIDIGAGNNELVQELRKKNPDGCYQGVDFSSPKADRILDITDPTFRDNYRPKQWDMLTAFDMMEHLRSGQLNVALTNMAAVSKQFIMTISFRESKHTVDGEPLHMTVKDSPWWEHAIGGYAAQMHVVSDEYNGTFRGVWK